MIKTNKESIHKLIHTAKDFYQFRKDGTQYKNVKEGSKQIKIKLPEESHAYGKPLE